MRVLYLIYLNLIETKCLIFFIRFISLYTHHKSLAMIISNDLTAQGTHFYINHNIKLTYSLTFRVKPDYFYLHLNFYEKNFLSFKESSYAFEEACKYLRLASIAFISA